MYPRHCIALGFLFMSILTSATALAGPSYEFCITRTGTSVEVFGARYKFGDIDPGKEVARVLVSQKYKQADTQSVSVSDYNSASCGGIRDEANITMTAEQLQALGQAIGRGDPVGVAVVAGEIVTGVTVKTVQGIGNAISNGAKAVGRAIKCIFGC